MPSISDQTSDVSMLPSSGVLSLVFQEVHLPLSETPAQFRLSHFEHVEPSCLSLFTCNHESY